MLATSNHLFLVTARHVLLTPDNKGLRSTTASIDWYTTVGTNGNKGHWDIDLGFLYQNGQIRIHPNHDVAVIRLAIYQNDELVTTHPPITFTNDVNVVAAHEGDLCDYTNVDIGDDAYVFGYPGAIGIPNIRQIDYSRPLLCKGAIAGKNDEAGTIILNAEINHGNSGGPAIEKDEVNIGQRNFLIIGVVTQYIPVVDTGVYGTFILTANSGYAVVEPCDNIKGLLWDN